MVKRRDIKANYETPGRPKKDKTLKLDKIPAHIKDLSSDLDIIKQQYILESFARGKTDYTVYASVVDIFGLQPCHAKDLVDRVLREYVEKIEKRDERVNRGLLLLAAQHGFETCINKNQLDKASSFLRLWKDATGIGSTININAGRQGVTAEDALGFSLINTKTDPSNVIDATIVAADSNSDTSDDNGSHGD
jgi:hypothetical protein